MSNITLSAGIRSNLLSLQNTSALQALTQNRLATGKKVNTALDNPTNYFTAQSLNARGADLSALLDGISNGIKTIEAADNGIRAITKLVENAQSAARQALQSGSTNLNVTSSVLTGGAGKTAIAADAGNFVVTIGSTTTTVAIATGDTVQKVVDAINALGTARAEVGTDNKLKITALGGESLSVDATTTAATATFLGVSTGAVPRAAGDVNTVRQNLAKQFNDLRAQIDQLAKDAGFNGINLLNGDSLKVVFNEQIDDAKQSKITIKGTTIDSTGLGVATVSTTGVTGFQADSEINASLKQLATAINTLRAQSSTFGSNLSVAQTRQEFTRATINTLKVGSDNLTLADQNEEAANLLSLQTRQQLATQALSLANQADQGVLRLF